MAGAFENTSAACFAFRLTTDPEREVSMHVYPHDEFNIGREQLQDALRIEDRCLSNHHLHIRCVVYGDDEENKIAPLIYVRILSGNPALFRRNGLHDNPQDGFDIGRHSGDILLNFGDIIQLTNQVEVELVSIEGQSFTPPPLTKLQRAEIGFIEDYRLTTKVLGVGGYAAVYVSEKADTGQQFACKIVAHPTEKAATEVQQKERQKVAREYAILAKLSHPNIISLEKVFQATHHDYIFQELITGGDLLSYMDKKGQLTEPQGAVIVRQLLGAAKYLHNNQVVHRDIKPENILVTSWRDGARIVLTDFGQSRTMDDVEHAAKKAGVFRMQTLVGTIGYTAPEVYAQIKKDLQQNAGYSQAVDIWSIGCVAGTVLTNELTFPCDDTQLRTGIVDISYFTKQLAHIDNGREWRHVGHRAKSFVKSCLATEEGKRLSAAQCLDLPWFQHPHYKREFDAAYQRAIADWKPRVHDQDLVETIDTSELDNESDGHGDTRSRFFVKSQSHQDSALAWFRPNEMCASPAQVPQTPPRQEAAAEEETQFDDFINWPLPPPTMQTVDSLEHNLDLASQNLAHNKTITNDHLPMQAAACKRKAVYR